MPVSTNVASCGSKSTSAEAQERKELTNGCQTESDIVRREVRSPVRRTARGLVVSRFRG